MIARAGADIRTGYEVVVVNRFDEGRGLDEHLGRPKGITEIRATVLQLGGHAAIENDHAKAIDHVSDETLHFPPPSSHVSPLERRQHLLHVGELHSGPALRLAFLRLEFVQAGPIFIRNEFRLTLTHQLFDSRRVAGYRLE